MRIALRRRRLFNPPHHGDLISQVYLAELGVSARELASALGTPNRAVHRLLTGRAGLSAELAVRLPRTLGRSAESWRQMQRAYDLWHARRNADLSGVRPVR